MMAHNHTYISGYYPIQVGWPGCAYNLHMELERVANWRYPLAVLDVLARKTHVFDIVT